MRMPMLSLLAIACAGCTPEEPETPDVPPITGVPSPSPSPSPTPAPPVSGYDLSGRILVVEGDELGKGEKSYAGLYARENPSLTTHNFSSSGATIETLMSRRDQVLSLKPDVLSIGLSLHDLCQADSAREWARAIDDYAQPFREIGTVVVINSPLPRDSVNDDDCDSKHNQRLAGAIERTFSSSFGFDTVAHFAGEPVLNAAGSTFDSNLFVDGVMITDAAQERLAEIYARTLNNVWSVLLDQPALEAPADDGQTIIVAEGSSSAVTWGPYFNGLYKEKGNFDEWHASAVGGSSLISLAERIDKVKFKNADVASIYIGANDLIGYDSAEAFASKLSEYTKQLRDRGTKVLVFTLPNRLIGDQIDHKHNTFRKQLKVIYDAADWIDGYADFAGHPIMGSDDAPLDKNLYKDSVHATVYGHSLYFQSYEPAMDAVLSKQHPSRK